MFNSVKIISVIITAVLVVGCGSTSTYTYKPYPKINISVIFDAEKASQLLAKGTNTIKGSALIRQSGGGIVTCAGNPVYLYPYTDYTNKRSSHIYGNSIKGYQKQYRVESIINRFNHTPLNYNTLRKETTCDARGYFKFADIANGDFYVTTKVIWHAGSYLPEGGWLMQKVTVENDEVKEIVLSP